MMEKLITEHLSKIMVTIPCEIVEINSETSLMTVKPLIFDELELPLIVDVPMQYIGTSKKYLKFKFAPGDRIVCLFSQMDLGSYISTGLTGQVNSVEKFNASNCIALPILATTELDKMKVPTVDFEIVGEVKIIGNVEIEGNITQKNGNITTTGKIEAEVDVIGAGISLPNHLTTGVTSGKDTSGKPQ